MKHYTPPRLAALLLGWLLKDRWETPLGDFEEYYNTLADAEGLSRAKLWYWGQVIRLLPDQLYEKFYWGLSMLKNYLLLGFRTLKRNKLASSINIVGLAAAVGCAITIFLVIQEVTIDDFHENGERVFLVEHVVEQAGRNELWGTAPVPLGPALASDFPQVEHAVRFAEQAAEVRATSYAFQEKIAFADPDFFEVLTFPLKQGQASALTDPAAVIISTQMAEKYFPKGDPMGQLLQINFGEGKAEAFTVQGVAMPFPERASLTFDFLMGYQKRFSLGFAEPDDWQAFTDGTFIELRQAADREVVEAQLSQYLPVQQASGEATQVQSFFMENIQDPNIFLAWKIHRRAMSSFPIWEMAGFAVIGLLLLLVSCFNYINISLGSASSRLKEIGIRKTSGAERRQLIVQFLTENLLLCYLALIGGLVIAWAFIIPLWHNITSMQLSLSLLSNYSLWLFLIGLFAFIGLVSGSYPAFYISSFEPITILRGKLKLGRQKRLTRVLTTIQFTLTVFTICLSLFISSLGNTLLGGDWGYNEAQSLVLPDLKEAQFARLQHAATTLPGVQQVAGAEHHIGSSLNARAINTDGEEKEVAFFGVGPAYLDAVGIKLAMGRSFGQEVSARGASGVVINQTLAKQQGWDDPIGQQIRLEDDTYNVIGVVNDFLLHPVLGKAHPAVFGLSETENHGFLTLQVSNGNVDGVVESLKATWQEEFPGMDFVYYPQAEVFQNFTFMLELSQSFSRYLGFFALLISCMGLFGMASQRVGQRMKEVGIRKAMGASALHIIFLVNRSFLFMLGLATLIATTVSYVGLRAVLQTAPSDIPMSVTPFVLASLIVFCVAAASLTSQTIKLLKVRPAEVLRYA